MRYIKPPKYLHTMTIWRRGSKMPKILVFHKEVCFKIRSRIIANIDRYGNDRHFVDVRVYVSEIVKALQDTK